MPRLLDEIFGAEFVQYPVAEFQFPLDRTGFILGTPVAGGLYGERPDLGYLYDDNLNFTTDFRTVYATLLEEWLGASSEAILEEKRLDTLPILSPP